MKGRKSSKTFLTEYEALKVVPGVFYESEVDYKRAVYGEKGDPYEAATETFRRNYYNDCERACRVLPQDYPLETFGDRKLSSAADLIEIIQDAVGISVEEIFASDAFRERIRSAIPARDAALGVDSFGCYLPFHAYGFSGSTPWGLYVFLEPLFGWVFEVYEKNNGRFAPAELVSLLFLVVYRHEMFHYHVERFAFVLEVLNRKPHYRPYIENVRASVANTERWLEEALAQAVVLSSTFVARRSSISKCEALTLIQRAFDEFGPGYRDYD